MGLLSGNGRRIVFETGVTNVKLAYTKPVLDVNMGPGVDSILQDTVAYTKPVLDVMLTLFCNANNQ